MWCNGNVINTGLSFKSSQHNSCMPRLSNTATATRQQNTQDVQLAFYRQYLTLTAGQNNSHMLLVATPLPSLPVDCHYILYTVYRRATQTLPRLQTLHFLAFQMRAGDMTPRTPPLRAALCTGQGCWPGLGQGWGTKVDSGGGGPQSTAGQRET